jgi:hypothetical protein
MWPIEPLGAQARAPETVRWLWPRYLPRGALGSLDGDPGCGKSMLTLDLAARLTRGAGWPDGSPGGPPGTAILFPAEDARDRVVHPRLIAAGADRNRVFVYGTPDAPDRPPCLPRDLSDLTALVERVRPDLMVLDPLPYFLTAASSGAVVRSVLSALAGLAGRFDVTILLVRHLMKFGRLKALYRGLGTIGIVGAARAGLLVAQDPRDAKRFVLTALKSNHGSTPDALAYRIKDERGVAVVEWIGPTAVTAEEASRGPDRAEPKGVLAAAEWLVQALSAGELPALEVLARALKAGISERTLERAKAEIHVRTRQVRIGRQRAWAWSLPSRSELMSEFGDLPKRDD